MVGAEGVGGVKEVGTAPLAETPVLGDSVVGMEGFGNGKLGI